MFRRIFLLNDNSHLFFNFLIFVFTFSLIGYGCSDSDNSNSNLNNNKVQNQDLNNIENQSNHPGCKYHMDCPKQKCINGECISSEKCESSYDCTYEEICFEARCVPFCTTDINCGAQAHCYQGVCRPFNLNLTDVEPNDGNSEKTELKAGVASVDLNFSVGVSMAGYGGHKGVSTPYQKSLKGSNGMVERPVVKAVVIDNGLERLVFLRTVTSWTTDFMLTTIARKLEERIGENYINKIIISANHSHSFPGRYWNILPDSPSFGILGYGSFSFEVFDRSTDSYVDAVENAINNLKPASFGYIVDNQFDPENRITSERRREDDDLPYDYNPEDNDKDNRMTIMRIDDKATGKPMAVIVNAGMHGTHMDSALISGDAPYAVEVIGDKKLSAHFDSYVPVIFMSGNTADISPRGDDNWFGDDSIGKCQRVGLRAAEKIIELTDKIETSSDIEISIVNRRIPMDRHYLKYGENEFYDEGADPHLQPYRFGALSCTGSGEKIEDGHLKCLLNVDDINGAPVAQMMKTRLTVVKIGDLVIATLPGEPTSRLGRKISAEIEKQHGFKDAITFGLSQDHHFYLMQREDWFLGGYEATMTMWPWKLGDYVIKHSIDLAGELVGNSKYDDADFDFVKPSYWDDYLVDDTLPPTKTESADIKKIVEDMPDKYFRLNLNNFKWIGGHPGVDLPHIILQKKDNNGNFKDFYLKGNYLYDDYGYEMILKYFGDWDKDHTWGIEWEELHDFELGKYRFSVIGSYYDGSQKESYELFSNEFEVVPTENMQISDVEISDSKLSFHIAYPPGKTNDDGETSFSKLIYFSHLVHSENTHPLYGYAPIASDIVKAKVTIVSPLEADPVIVNLDDPLLSGDKPGVYISKRNDDRTESTAQEGTVPFKGFELPHGLDSTNIDLAYSITIEITDTYDNSGVLVFTENTNQ